MNDPNLTRRAMNRRMLALGGLLSSGVWALEAVAAQPTKQTPAKPTTTQPSKSQPTKPQPSPTDTKKPNTQQAETGNSFLEQVIKKGRTRDWTLKVNLHLDSYQTPTQYVQPNQQLTITAFKFQTAAILFPVLAGTASSETVVGSVQSTLRFDGKDLNIKPQFLDDYPAGARFGRWDMRAMEGRQIDLDLEIPLTTWAVLFDEAAASKAVWPTSNKWPKVAQSTFTPQRWVDTASPVVSEAVSKWCDRKPPQSLPPIQLTKFLAGKVMEAIQPSGNGLAGTRTGLFEGFDLKGAEQTLKEGRGSEHDIACVLAAVYRVAGVPCRTVIGYDITESKGQDSGSLGKRTGGDSMRSWVEFCLYDEPNKKEIWVPVDVVRQRKSGNRPPPLDKPWKFFGANDDTDDVLPVAFQYHPPTTVIAYGAPALWGWMTTPEMQQATQFLRFNSQSTPRRPDDRKSSPFGK